MKKRTITLIGLSLLFVINSFVVFSAEVDPCCNPGKCYVLVGNVENINQEYIELAALEAASDCIDAGLKTEIINPADYDDFKNAIQDACAREYVMIAHGPGKSGLGKDATTAINPAGGAYIYGDIVEKWLEEAFGKPVHPCTQKLIIHSCGVSDEWRELFGVDDDHFFGSPGNTNPLFIFWWQFFHSQKPEDMDLRFYPNDQEQKSSCAIDSTSTDDVIKSALMNKIIEAWGDTNFYAKTSTRQLFIMGISKTDDDLVSIVYNPIDNPGTTQTMSSGELFNIMSRYYPHPESIEESGNKLNSIISYIIHFFTDLLRLFQDDYQEIRFEGETAADEIADCGNSYHKSDCNQACRANSKCVIDPGNSACYYCQPMCANDEYYNDQACRGLCIDGISKCIQSSDNPPCFWCKPTCQRGETNDPKCNNMCTEDQRCIVSNQEGPCYYCKNLDLRSTAYLEYPEFKIDKVDNSYGHVQILGSVIGNTDNIKEFKINHLVDRKTNQYPIQFDRKNKKFVFEKDIKSGRHIFVIQQFLINNDIIGSIPIIVTIPDSEIISRPSIEPTVPKALDDQSSGTVNHGNNCTGTNLYSSTECLNACRPNQKCTAVTYPQSCYACESVCGASEYYNDNSCADLCTESINECRISDESVPCYYCKPSYNYTSFEFLNSETFSKESTVSKGKKYHIVVTSKYSKIFEELPIEIVVYDNDLEIFRNIIPDNPELNCRDEFGCSMEGPVFETDTMIKIFAYNKDNQIIAEYIQ